MKMTNSNKITNTKVGDDIHFYVNGSEDRGIVVKMNNDYVTVFKESTQEYDDIHINDTFFIKDILVNKEWDKMEDDERFEALKKIHAPSPRFIMKSWNDLPKEIKELLTKNNAIETSHKEGKDDDMNNATRTFDKSGGGTELADEGDKPKDDEGTAGKPTGEKTITGEKVLEAGDMKQGKKQRKEHIGDEGADKFGHGKRSHSGQETPNHTRATDSIKLLSQQVSKDPEIAASDKIQEGQMGRAAQHQSDLHQARQLASTEQKKIKERKERKENTSTKVPKKVTDAMSKLKAWQLWLAKREQEVLKDGVKEKLRNIYEGGKKVVSDEYNRSHPNEIKNSEQKEKSFFEQWLEDKSNTERSIHGNAGREPNSGVNTNTGFDAPKDYEGFSHSGVRPEQFKHERKKPKVTNKERINIGSTAPSNPSQGTGDGGNPHNTRQQNKDVKGRAVSGKDRK